MAATRLLLTATSAARSRSASGAVPAVAPRALQLSMRGASLGRPASCARCVGFADSSVTSTAASMLRRSVSTTRPTLDDGIVEVINREIELERADQDAGDELADLLGQIPGFEVADVEGHSRFTLTKKHGSDTVTVRVDCSSLAELSGEGELSDLEESGASDAFDDGDADAPAPTGYEMVVTVAKADGTSLRFLGVVAADLVIDAVHFLRPGTDSLAGGKENEDAYLGPVFDDLDLALQQSFYDFLADRGIDDNLADLLSTVCEAKEQAEYVRWLENVRSVVGPPQLE